MTEFKLLVNPSSGGGLGKKLLQSPLPIAAQETHPNKINQQLIDFLTPGDTLIIAGGDGTLNLIINSLYQCQLLDKISIAFYPIGTGNDFAHAFKTPHLPFTEYFAQLQSSNTVIELPLWRLGEHIFINYLCWGIGAKVIAEVHRWRKHLPCKAWFTKLLYIISGLKNLFLAPKFAIEKDQPAVISYIISNINYYAGGCQLGDERQNYQSSLNCFRIHNRREYIRLLLTRITKKPLSASTTVNELNVNLCNIPVQIDGEPYAGCEGVIETIGKIKIRLCEK